MPQGHGSWPGSLNIGSIQGVRGMFQKTGQRNSMEVWEPQVGDLKSTLHGSGCGEEALGSAICRHVEEQSLSWGWGHSGLQPGN